jgi:plasmid maintenance system killer protein
MSLKAHEMTISCKPTLKVGDMLNNKWVTLGFIYMGRMSEVYRTHQTNLNRDVAIKVISSECLEPIDERKEIGNSGNRSGLYSIRINRQWRICFEWHQDGAYSVEIVDYH